jgi:hypothetical protein
VSDLLGRLASRAAGSRPALRPRLGGLFEPAGSAAPARVDPRVDPGDGARGPDEVVARPVAAPPRPDRPEPPPAPIAPPASARSTPDPDPAPGPSARPAPVPAAPAAPARDSAPPEARPAGLGTPSGAPTVVAPEPALRELRRSEPLSGVDARRDGRRARRRPDLGPAERVIVERHRETVEHAAVSRIRSGPEPGSSSETPSAVVPAVPAPPAAPLPARREPAGTGRGAAPEPAVRVTIGRLEVRVRPAERPSHGGGRAAERPAPAVMGLDEYLARRAGGGR